MPPKSRFEVARDIAHPLTAVERIAFESIKQIATEGRVATKAEVCAAIGSQNYDGGTVPGILKRLEAKGYVTRQIHQRGMRICIPSLGICTAPPKDQSPHWRDRDSAVPTPTIQHLRQRAPEDAAVLERIARTLNQSPLDFAADCVWNGLKIHPLYAEIKEGKAA